MSTYIDKTGLENLPQATPPDRVWDNIEQQLDGNKRRLVPLWLRMTVGAAASLVILVSAWMLFSNIERETANVAATKQPVQQDKTVVKEQQHPVIANTPAVTDSLKLNTNAVSSYILMDSSVISTTLALPGLSTYQWHFGDGTTSNLTFNSYSSPGTYIIRGYNGNEANVSYLDVNDSYAPLEFEGDFDFNVFRGNVFEKDALGKLTYPEADSLSLYTEPVGTESYASLIENEYQSPLKEPLSTFSIDVDNASYSNTRRMIQAGEKPPKDAVRIEEFVNYFDYSYEQPKNDVPFSIITETASCPWNKETNVVSIALKGKDVDRDNLPASNLVFLIDVSGSMADENKLPLVKQSLKLLVDQMRPQDRVAIVAYAGNAGLVLESTACSEKQQIKSAIDNLESGGSTAGGEGLELAYKVAGENLVKNGNNRIILVTDGDFNVGLQTDSEMETLIEQKRKLGIYLTVCGFGMGNYKDSKMEILADKGNGNYYYIDTYKEGKKVFVTGLTGTLFTIAKDVKIQVEFNPRFVKAYRLIGYENRKMPPQDFDDDTKDAGELGAGHTVTALYEIVPADSKMKIEGFTDLKYQQINVKLNDSLNDLLTVKLRYKKPGEETSRLLQHDMPNYNQDYKIASDNLKYACGVTAFAMLLRDSKFKGDATYTLARELLLSTQLNVNNGFREELLQLITKAEGLSQ